MIETFLIMIFIMQRLLQQFPLMSAGPFDEKDLTPNTQ
jgi:hypothetical protein